MFTNIKGAIFDLDGTLIDSMNVWTQIDIDYLKEIGQDKNVDFLELKKDINHLSYRDTAKYFKNRFNIPDSIEAISSRWHDMAFDSYKNKVKLKEGAKEFLESLHALGIKIGLATSNSLELAKVSLEANGISHLFENITITNEVSRGKNFPDVYLLSAERLGLKPEDCMVFEDILAAVEGAKKGNFKVAAVYDESSKSNIEKIKDKSDLYINSYAQLLITN